MSPNAISVASVGFAAVGAVAFTLATRTEALLQAACFAAVIVCVALRSICNMIDGMVAVEGGKATPSGPLFNEFPDRISDALFFVGAGVASASQPWGEHLGWLAALLAVTTAYARSLGAATGAGDDFRGPMAKPTRMAILAVACGAAAVESVLDTPPVSLRIGLAIVCVGCVVTIARRLRWAAKALEAKP